MRELVVAQLHSGRLATGGTSSAPLSAYRQPGAD
jgi:hypothetical protein